MRNRRDRYGIDRSMKPFAIAAAALGLASCETTSSPVSGICPAVSSSDWQAWVNAMPGPNARPRLIATGRVTMPTGGYRYRWGDLRVMESYPVQISVQLIPIPPSGPATQALESQEVRGEWPMSPPVGSLTITCGDKILGRVAPVQTAS
jgi:hypothetical protein